MKEASAGKSLTPQIQAELAVLEQEKGAFSLQPLLGKIIKKQLAILPLH